jgi:hypothetical protein
MYNHGHDLTCPKSEYFGMTAKQKQDVIQEKRRMKALKLLPASDVRNNSIGDGIVMRKGFFMQKQQDQAITSTGTQQSMVLTAGVTTAGLLDDLAITAPSLTPSPAPSPAPAKVPPIKVLPGITTIPEDALSAATIKVKIVRHLCKTSTKANNKKDETSRTSVKANNEKDKTYKVLFCAPTGRCFFDYLLSLVPLSAEASDRATVTNAKLAFYKRVFPPGTMLFTIPNNDPTLGPSNPDYAMIQGVKIHIK